MPKILTKLYTTSVKFGSKANCHLLVLKGQQPEVAKAVDFLERVVNDPRRAVREKGADQIIENARKAGSCCKIVFH